MCPPTSDFDPMVMESLIYHPGTLDKSVLAARPRGAEEILLLENGVDENVTDADWDYMEVTATGEVEGTPFSEHDVTSDPGEGTEAEPAQEQEPSSLAKPHGKDNVIDEQQYEGGGGSASKFSWGGSSVPTAAKGRVDGKKKRKVSSVQSPGGGSSGRAKRGPNGGAKKVSKGGAKKGEQIKSRENWTDTGTEDLLRAVPKKTSVKVSSNEPSWGGIAKAVPGRTGIQCQRRMDTLWKAFLPIRQNIEKQQKEVWQLTDEDWEAMISTLPKLSTRFKRSWYEFVCDYCPPRSYKKMMNQGAGSVSENGMNSDSSAPTLESTKVVTATPDQGKRSKPAMEPSAVVPEKAKVVSSADPGDQSISSSPASAAVMVCFATICWFLFLPTFGVPCVPYLQLCEIIIGSSGWNLRMLRSKGQGLGWTQGRGSSSS